MAIASSPGVYDGPLWHSGDTMGVAIGLQSRQMAFSLLCCSVSDRAIDERGVAMLSARQGPRQTESSRGGHLLECILPPLTSMD